MRKNLKEARLLAGMTQKQVAEYLGIKDRKPESKSCQYFQLGKHQ